jgi:hypothetical protein
MVVGEKAEYMGQGDPCPKFDNMVRSVNLLAKIIFEASLGIGASTTFVPTACVYPTQELYDDYHSTTHHHHLRGGAGYALL